ncbi:MAG: restriction endonuclease subunit S [Planctomycetota bacterium]
MKAMENRERGSAGQPQGAAMKKGWQTKNLGDLCEIELGKTPARANASFWDEKRETSNVWLSIADLLKAEDNVVVDSKEYVSDKGAAICKLVPKGTLLVSFKLTLGRLAFAGRDLFTNEAIAALTIFNERELSKEFLFYCLTFFDWVKAAENDVKLKGMTLNKAKLKVMPVSFPPLAEQQRIVGLLDEAFEGLATAKANAEKNLQNARALFESHLQSVFTQRGPGWVEKTLGDVIEIVGGSQPPKSVFSKAKKADNIRLIQIRDYKSDKHVVFIPRAQARRFCNADDVMIGRYGPPLFQILRGIEGAYNVALMKAVPDEAKLSRDFLFYFLKHSAILQYVIYHSSRAAGQIGVTKETLEPYPIALPSLAVQKTVVENIQELDTETQRLAHLYEQKLAALEALKKSLLHQAFTGEL